MSDKRYNEEEVAAIFKSAAAPHDAQRNRVSASTGMTLAELQEIGREVGLSPEDVARAAAALEVQPKVMTRRVLGAPVTVGRTVDLPRPLSDAEWEQLVVDLRTTFRARGRLEMQGSFRQWSNGNLQALLEPTPAGQRLRLQTTRGGAREQLVAGAATVGIGVGLTLFDRVTGAGISPLLGTMALVGTTLIGIALARLPNWARTRRRQFDEVAARLLASLNQQS